MPKKAMKWSDQTTNSLNRLAARGKLRRRIRACSPQWRVPIDTAHLLIFSLDGQRYALPLDNVTRVIRAAALTRLPQAPDIVLGVLDLQGEVIPVINLRKRFSLPDKPICCEDQFVVARTRTLTLALAVDGTLGVLEPPDHEVFEPEDIVEGTAYLAGIARTAEGLVLIHDLDTLLFPREEELIAQALEQM